MQIKIILKSNFQVLKLDVDTITNKFFVNNVQKNINTFEFAEKLCNILLSWQTEYIGPNVIDGESFIVEVVEENSKKTYTGFNAFPQNYNKFLKLVFGVAK